MIKRLRQVTLWSLLVLAGLLLGRGFLLIGYEPETSDGYLWGAFHVHSTLSDGLLPLEAIADEAREARVSFVLMSDHGGPHPEASVLDREIGGVRFIGGSEVGGPEGHLIVSGLDSVPNYKLPPFPPDAVRDAAELGGIAVVTYPEDPVQRWRYWERDFLPHGMEILNVTSYFRASSAWRKLRWAFYSTFNPYYYLTGFEPPVYALGRWDEMLERGPVVPFYANNAHGGFPLSETRTIDVPSYATAFSYVGLGVESRHRDALEEAIRSGDFFAIVRGAGEPQRFEFRADGSSALESRVEVLDLSTRMVLKRNGSAVAETEAGKLRYEATEPGVYRIEVYLEDHPLLSSDVPWILSNAISIGLDYAGVREEEIRCAAVDTVPLMEFRVETDPESEAELSLHDSGELELEYHLSAATAERVDRWVALALRRPLELSRYLGITLEAYSSETMRYWLELRSREREYYASFKVRPDVLNRLTIPWNRFYAVVGGRGKPPLFELDSLFISVNTSNSRTGFSSRLTLNKLGFCR